MSHEGKNTWDPRTQTRMCDLVGIPWHFPLYHNTNKRTATLYVMELEGQGGDAQRKTILNSGYLVMVEICMIFSFSFFLFSRKCRGGKPSGIMGKSVSSGAWLQMIIVIPSLVVLLLPSFSYSLNLAQQLEGHFSKTQVRPYYSPLLQTLP